MSVQDWRCLSIVIRQVLKEDLTYSFRKKKTVTGHIPEHSYSAHHNSSSLLVETHSNVLNTWWFYPVSCTRCDSYSPLTTGMLVLCDELYAASSTLGDWCCVLKLKGGKHVQSFSICLTTKNQFQSVKFDDKIQIPNFSQIRLILMMFWEI